METTVLLARLLGPVFLVAGLGLLLNPERYGRILRAFSEDSALCLVSGLLALTAGVAILLFHNLWVADWRVVITLIGWVAVLKGVALLIFPQAGQTLAGRLQGKTALLCIGVFDLLLGNWLCYAGFAA